MRDAAERCFVRLGSLLGHVPGHGRETKKIVTTATGRHCRIVPELWDDQETHEPVPDSDRNGGRALAKAWFEGFEQAIRSSARADGGFATLAGFGEPDPPVRIAERRLLAEGARLAPTGAGEK